MRHYELGHSQPGSTVPGPDVLLNLDSITEWGGSAGLATSFTYANPGPAYTNYGYLTRVQNAFGGKVTFEAAELYPQTPYQDHWTRKIITARTEIDRVTNQQAIWRYNSSGWLDDAGGFARVWVTQPDNRQTLHVYNQTPCYANASTPRIVSCPLAGREQRTYLCTGYDGTTCQQEWTRQETDWQADAASLPFGTGLDAWNKPYFVRVSAERQYELSFAMRRTDYTYDPARQGNVQYGNLTGSQEYAGAGTGWASAPVRASATWYYPNPTQWIVDRPGKTLTYSGAEATLLAERRYRYDNQAHTTPPTQGRLTHLETLGVLNGSLTGATHTESYGYDGYGNLASVQDASGNTRPPSTTAGSARSRSARKVLDPTTNHTTKLFYHGVPGGRGRRVQCRRQDIGVQRFGLPERMVDPNNVIRRSIRTTTWGGSRPSACRWNRRGYAALHLSGRGRGGAGSAILGACRATTRSGRRLSPHLHLLRRLRPGAATENGGRRRPARRDDDRLYLGSMRPNTRACPCSWRATWRPAPGLPQSGQLERPAAQPVRLRCPGPAQPSHPARRHFHAKRLPGGV